MTKPILVTKHKPRVCQACGPMLVCKTCGNNACNAGHGTVEGQPCPDCQDCYSVQDLWWKHPNYMEFDPPLTDEQKAAFADAREATKRSYAVWPGED